jgi:hypothetical protein
MGESPSHAGTVGKRALRIASSLSTLLCIATAVLCIASYFRPLGVATIHRYVVGEAVTGTKAQVISLIDGIFYDYVTSYPPHRARSPGEIDLPYRMYGTKVRLLSYEDTWLGFSYVPAGTPRARLGSQWSMPFALAPMALAVLPIWRRRWLGRYLKAVGIAAFVIAVFRWAFTNVESQELVGRAISLGSILALTVVWIIVKRRKESPSRVPWGCCRHCGYDLTGNVSGVCPECGNPVSPGVQT